MERARAWRTAPLAARLERKRFGRTRYVVIDDDMPWLTVDALSDALASEASAAGLGLDLVVKRFSNYTRDESCAGQHAGAEGLNVREPPFGHGRLEDMSALFLLSPPRSTGASSVRASREPLAGCSSLFAFKTGLLQGISREALSGTCERDSRTGPLESRHAAQVLRTHGERDGVRRRQHGRPRSRRRRVRHVRRGPPHQ